MFSVIPRLDIAGSRRITNNTNSFSIINWTPWSSHGVTIEKPVHVTTLSRNDVDTNISKYKIKN